MTGKQREAFEALVKYQNQRDAAKKLGIVQSTFNARLKTLVNQLERKRGVNGFHSVDSMRRNPEYYRSMFEHYGI